MAMINCPECGKEISDSAISCPNCGFEMKRLHEKIMLEEQLFRAKEEQRKAEEILLNMKKPLLSSMGLCVLGIFLFSIISGLLILSVLSLKKKEMLVGSILVICSCVTILVCLTWIIKTYRKINIYEKAKFYHQRCITYVNTLSAGINYNKNKPRCLVCGSTNIQHISMAAKVGGYAMWGVFSSKLHRKWKCNNCGSEF